MKIPYWTSLVTGLLAVAVVLLSVISRPTPDPTTHIISENWHLLSSLLEAIGIAFIVTTMFTVIIEFKEWRDYFGERVRDFIMDHSYMRSLDARNLRFMQRQIDRILYGDGEVDRDSSYYNYLHTNLENHVTEPFRDWADCNYIYEEDGGSTWRVHDTLSYTCRSGASGRIQPSIFWVPDDDDEYESIEKVVVKARIPAGSDGSSNEIAIENWTRNSDDGVRRKPNSYDLSQHKLGDKDGLRVTMDLTYTVDKQRFQTWVMVIPTREFTISIVFPKHLRIQILPMALDKNFLETTVDLDNGFAKVTYSSWMLPGSGLAWRIYPAQQPTVAAPVSATE